MSDWWKNLTLEEKKEYIKKHPRSKKALAVKRAIQAKKHRLADKHGKPASPEIKRKAYEYLRQHNGQTSSELNESLDEIRRRFNNRINKLENKQIKDLYEKTVKAVKSEKNTHHIKELTKTSGIIFISAAALSIFFGVDLSSSVAGITSGYGDKIRDYTARSQRELDELDEEEKETKFKNDEERAKFKQIQDEKRRRAKIEYLKRVHDEMIREAKENTKDPKKVADSLVTNKPDYTHNTIVKEEPVNLPAPSENTTKKEIATKDIDNMTKISINSSHETDILKALIKLEKLEIASISKNNPENILSTIGRIENIIPTTASIMVSSIGKPSIMNRAKVLLNKYNIELSSKKEELNKLAEKANMKKSPLDFYIKKHIKYDGYTYEKSYVLNEDKKIQLCEHHILRSVEAANCTLNKVEIYNYSSGNDINISVVKDSHFMPKSFSCIKPRELASWLKEHIC